MKHIDLETKAFSDLYSTLLFGVNDFPEKEWNEYTKKQRLELIQRISDYIENNDTLSLKSNELLPVADERQFCNLRQKLISANDKYTEFLRLQREKWVLFAGRFDTQTEEAIIRAIDNSSIYQYGLKTNEQTGALEFSNDTTSSYSQSIYLDNPVFSDNYDRDDIMCDMEIDVSDNGYKISFMQRDELVTIDFTDLRLETQLFDYTATFLFGGSAWLIISEILTVIRTKKGILGEDFLNTKEKTLWRLGAFSPIHGIGKKHVSVSSDKKADELFCAYAVKAGNDCIAELTRQYSETNSSISMNDKDREMRMHFRSKGKACKALIKEMEKPSSEKLIRLILEDLKEAAAEYPNVVELHVPPDELKAAYQVISETFHAMGYKGEYPHFRKMSAIKCVRLAEMQGQPVFIGHEKYMASMIDCFADNTLFNEQALRINFTASTVFLKKGELHKFESLDGLSGYFPYKHRRRTRSVTPAVYHGDDINYSLKESAIIAAKTAELEKLTKKERRDHLIGNQRNNGFVFLVLMAISLGTLFGLFMVPAMLLLALLAGIPLTFLVSDAPPYNEYVQMMLEYPWHNIFAFCIIGFGLPMVIIIALSNKRG